ncbi:MAG: hypothetical protein UV57_C0004G0007 [Parcubacteria group bacterium GW2011_GWD2_43_10]|nr:MAG: hypothetical protein UV57_C0004G0007 [Parcubacteria group bacterium GW2011_GWD2_43_10]
MDTPIEYGIEIWGLIIVSILTTIGWIVNGLIERAARRTDIRNQVRYEIYRNLTDVVFYFSKSINDLMFNIKEINPIKSAADSFDSLPTSFHEQKQKELHDKWTKFCEANVKHYSKSQEASLDVIKVLHFWGGVIDPVGNDSNRLIDKLGTDSAAIGSQLSLMVDIAKGQKDIRKWDWQAVTDGLDRLDKQIETTNKGIISFVSSSYKAMLGDFFQSEGAYFLKKFTLRFKRVFLNMSN